MNIYKIWVDRLLGHDTYDSAIVVAENEEAARHIHPEIDPKYLVRVIILRLVVMISHGMKAIVFGIGQNQKM